MENQMQFLGPADRGHAHQVMSFPFRVNRPPHFPIVHRGSTRPPREGGGVNLSGGQGSEGVTVGGGFTTQDPDQELLGEFLTPLTLLRVLQRSP